MEKKPITSIVAGLIIALIIIILFIIYYFTGLAFHNNIIKWIPYFLLVILVALIVVKWASDNNDNVTFGSCFSYGFKTLAMSTVIVFIFTAIFLNLFPDYKSRVLEMVQQSLDEKGTISEVQKAHAMEMTSKFFMIGALGGSLFFNLFFGTLGTLIGAGVAKKNPLSPFDQPMI